MGLDELGGGLAFIEGAFQGETWIGKGAYAKGGTGGCKAVRSAAEQTKVGARVAQCLKASGKADEIAVDHATQHGGVAAKGDMELVEDPVVYGGGHRG